jgi:hypothetical protein
MGTRRPDVSGPLLRLCQDPSWSDEGLFALLQGFRRLTARGGHRANLPIIDVGI